MKKMKIKAKAMNYKYLIISALILLAGSSVLAQNFTEKRTYRQAVKVNRQTSLDIRNKYGTIHLSPSRNDSVKVVVEIEANASNHEKTSKMLSGININITQADNLVIAQTQFTESITQIFEDFKGLTNKLIQYDSRIVINYFITAPEYMDLRIDNKYGDVIMENCSGDVYVSLSNGSLRAGELEKKVDLDLSFCDANIEKLPDATLDLSFSEIKISDIGSARISSVSSRFDFKNAGKINTDSKRDKFFIGTLGSLKGDAYFTDFRIEKLTGDLDLLSKYGSLDIELIEKGFGNFSLNSGFSDIDLKFESSASYTLDLRHTNTSIMVPETNASLEKKAVNEDRGEYITYGKVGRGQGQKTVKIEANRSRVYIR